MERNKIISPNTTFTFNVEEKGQTRLDTFIAQKFPNYSRTYFKKLIEEERVSLNGAVVTKSGYSIKPGDEVIITFPPAPEIKDIKVIEKDLGVEVLYEHPDFLIISKPAGLMVHKSESQSSAITLVDWLINKFNEISEVGMPERPGIVHRLDMMTSGIMVIPRNNYSLMTFGNMFKERLIQKTYLAVVKGHPDQTGKIDYAIMRHPVHRAKMTHVKKAVKQIGIRNALTYYKVLEYYKDSSLVEVKPVTGRTHQIRVHFTSINHPLIGDDVYGQTSELINRQALHAYSLAFEYEGKSYNFTCEIPEDFKKLIEKSS